VTTSSDPTPSPVTLTVHDMQPYTPGPDEQDEISDMIAKHRQRGPWRLTLPAADLGARLRGGQMTKTELTRALAARLRESAWGADAAPDSELGQLMTAMAACPDDDTAEELLGHMYDAADDDRVWIEP
jgi:hypothetical protein